jgi:biopolymer transport protein ExbD
VKRRRPRALDRLQTGAQLRMTSMMDILVTLLFFVLKSFVMEGEAATAVPGIELPRSTSPSSPAASIPVAVLREGILVNNEVVATTESVRGQSGLWVAALGAKLEADRLQSEKIARLQGETAPHPVVTLQGDRDIEYQVLEKVMYTLDRAGYRDVALAVIPRTADGG